MRLLDDVGIAQHATYAVVAREHGYCLDDNARGLLLAASMARLGLHRPQTELLFARTAAFVQHAWHAGRGRFHNFMGFDRRWLEDVGSEDSHGRAVWALGVVARDAPDEDAGRWALELMDRAAPALPSFTSPRALACGLLGLCAARSTAGAADLRDGFAGRLCDHLRDSLRPDWRWFEGSLSYDNAQLSNALLAAARWADRPEWKAAGLDTLDWLWRAQLGRSGCFSPIGTRGFWRRGSDRAQFDQQPLEAAAMVAACLSAWRATLDPVWLDRAAKAHAWFLGDNDVQTPLVVPETGACRDGLHPDRVNANQGAESTLAWLQADSDYRTARAEACIGAAMAG